MTQLALIEAPPIFDPNTWDFKTPPPPNTNAAKFVDFHRENPHVAEILHGYAIQAIDAGRSRVGMWLLWQRARWDFTVQTVDDEDYKMPDRIIAYYTRYLMVAYPELDGFFTTRGIRIP